MKLSHIPYAQFCKKPWKNGLGTTHDIHLAPDGTNHDTFEMRFAMSPIVEDNTFSSFPGVERVITPVIGGGLELQFEDKTVRVAHREGYRFDTGLSPFGRLADGPITVVNVMARRTAWHIDRCEVVGPMEQRLDHQDIVFVFALADVVVKSKSSQVSLSRHDALLAHGKGAIQWTDTVLFAHLSVAR